MTRLIAMLTDPANVPELLLFALIATLIVLGVVALIVNSQTPKYRVPSIDPRCERPGSQAEFVRRLRARGAL